MKRLFCLFINILFLCCKEKPLLSPFVNDDVLLIYHNSIILFEKKPQEFIDEIMKKLVILPCESHGQIYCYGSELINEYFIDYPSFKNWSRAAESYRIDGLRWNCAYRISSNWSGLCGEGLFFTSLENQEDIIEELECVGINSLGYNNIVLVGVGI